MHPAPRVPPDGISPNPGGLLNLLGMGPKPTLCGSHGGLSATVFFYGELRLETPSLLCFVCDLDSQQTWMGVSFKRMESLKRGSEHARRDALDDVSTGDLSGCP